MKLFGVTITSTSKYEAMLELNEILETRNKNQAGQLNSLNAELVRERSAHNRTLESNTNLKQGFELLEKKYQAEIEVLNRDLQELRDQKAEIEQERVELVKDKETLAEGMLILKKKYDQLNMTVGDIVGPWKQKVQKLQGRLGAYVKKYGDLPHKREEQRKRKAAKNQPSEEKLEKTTY